MSRFVRLTERGLGALKRVAVVGGTHGNELPGVYLQKFFGALNSSFSFELISILANPSAVKANVRYCEEDLNRCFHEEDLAMTNHNRQTLERKRSLVIDESLGPKRSIAPGCDFILDLHNTTSNVGVLLCFHPKDDLSSALYAHLRRELDDLEVRAVHWSVPEGKKDCPYLPTIARGGMTVEIGPCAHSTLDSRAVDSARRVVFESLSFLNSFNTSDEISKNDAPRPYTRVKSVDYPRDSHGEICAFVHRDVVSERDLSMKLEQGQPLFQKVNGEAHSRVVEASEAGLRVLFANEAAYYEKGVALYLYSDEEASKL